MKKHDAAPPPEEEAEVSGAESEEKGSDAEGPERVPLSMLEEAPIVSVSLELLRPTQLAVGMQQVREKLAKLEHKGIKERKPQKIDKFLRKAVRRIPAVLGPPLAGEGEKGPCYYIVDHHHLCLALMQHGIEEAYVAQLDDLSALSLPAFWSAMDARGRLWRHGADGVPLSLEQFMGAIPTRLTDLEDDPYRSLAALLRHAGGYEKSRVPYSEFRWANYLRARVPCDAAGGGGRAGEQALHAASGAARHETRDAALVDHALPAALRLCGTLDASAAHALQLPGRGHVVL